MTAAEIELWATDRAAGQHGPGGDPTPEQRAAYWAAVAAHLDWGDWLSDRSYDVDLTPDWRQA